MRADEVERVARELTPSQQAAVLWCNADGTPRQHEKGAPSRTSFYMLKDVCKGDPTKKVCRFYRLITEGKGGKVKDRLWPESTWALTPLGLAVRAYLKDQPQ